MGEYIKEILKQWKEESGAKGVIQFKYFIDGTLTIYSAYSGYLIGKEGHLVNKYKEILKELLHDFNSIKFEETNYHYVE